MSMGDEKSFAPAEAVSWTDAGGDLLIFNQASGGYHSLNAAGSAAWRAMGEGASESEIVDRLAARFDAGREQIAPDVAAFLAHGLSSGIIVAR